MMQPYAPLNRHQLDAIARVLDAFLREHVHPVSAHLDPYPDSPCALMTDAAVMRAWIGHATRGTTAEQDALGQCPACGFPMTHNCLHAWHDGQVPGTTAVKPAAQDVEMFA